MESFKKSVVKLIKRKVKTHVQDDTTIFDSDDDDVEIDVYSKPMANPKLFSVINTLSAINLKSVKPPRMVVVGTQSSGKSSLLNGIIGMGILPTGKDMVTRTPLILQLETTPEESPIAVFGTYSDTGVWEEDKIIDLEGGSYEDEISTTIQRITIEIAGENMSVNHRPIYLRVSGPEVPTMSLVDLPGLTMVAQKDRGQPNDIKDRIRNMAKDMITEKNTIIMCVMAARSDLETDMALDLAKEVDPDGDRSIGILTKVDLMNKDSHIGNYLDGTCSSDLWFRYGYYAVRNKTSEDTNIESALISEQIFFNSHPIYTEYEAQTGIRTVAKQLSTILMSKIQEEIPNIKYKIDEELYEIKDHQESIGVYIPTTNISEIFNVLDKQLTTVAAKFNNDINSQGINSKYGSELRTIFSKYREKNKSIRPIPNAEALQELINNSQGNHMDVSVSPISIVEQSILGGSALENFIPDAEALVKDTVTVLESLVTGILAKQRISHRFPMLANEITSLLHEYFWNQENVTKKIRELVEVEKSYLWTEDTKFRDTLLTKSESKDLVAFIQTLCEQYLITIDDNFSNIVPKLCMKELVIKSKEMHMMLKSKIQTYSLERLQYLLMEDNSINHKRNELNIRYQKLQSAKHLLDQYW